MKPLHILFGIILTTSILFSSQSCEKEDDDNNTNNTPNYGSFTDNRDGQVYKTIQIGEQDWMAENLATKLGLALHC